MPVDSPANDHAPMLLAWYDRQARALPWRSPPGAAAADAYAVWLSEIMLQQTTVASATGYFKAFIQRWPSVHALAAAADADVMQAWAGLGYYARARNLLACARLVAGTHGGVFPDTEAELLRLPGIGPYTAAAIAAIAFARPATVVDGNVERVIARLFAVPSALPAAKPQLRALAASLTPEARPGDYAQAMMDLGATICTPRRPRCLLCPVSAHCVGTHRDPAQFPVKAAKPQRPVRHGIVYWLEHGGAVFVVQRPPRGLLGGMRALPTSAWLPAAPPQASPAPPKASPAPPKASPAPPKASLAQPPAGPQAPPPAPAAWRQLSGTVRHGFTHFELHLTVAVAAPASRPETPLDPSGIWLPVADIAAAGLPTVFAKAARHVLANRNAHAPDGLCRFESA